MTEKSPVTRRTFLESAGALAAAGSFEHPAVGEVKGANETVRFGVIGPGGRGQVHVRHLLSLKEQGKLVDIVGVCDVWDGNKTLGRGLYPTAERCGLDPADKPHVTKDYRRLLDSKDVDAVMLATPDHWHAKMTIDACEAGKDVFCEKPMTHTIDEARRVVEAVTRHRRVMTVGVQSTAHPQWRAANRLITDGKIGHVMHAQTGYFRNSDTGQWRYPISADMTPKTVDWKMFLGTEFGLAPEMPFNRAKYGQWRCYWEFGGGIFTDLFVHQLTHLILAVGVRLPRRVVAGGGLFLEYDGRVIPDTATLVIDYDEGCQIVVTGTMGNTTPLDEVIRGHTGTIKFTSDGFDHLPQRLTGRPGPPLRDDPKPKDGRHVVTDPPKGIDADTRALWEHFLECIRSRNPETLCPPELGQAGVVTATMGVQSYRDGKALFFDKGTGKVAESDPAWIARWEGRSRRHGKPDQVPGWHAGDEGSLLHPFDYQALEGDWVDGEDPASKG